MPKNQTKLDDDLQIAFQRLAKDSVTFNRCSWNNALKLKPTEYPEFNWPDEEALRMKHPNMTYKNFNGIYNDAYLKCLRDNISRLCDAYGIEQFQDGHALLSILLPKYVPGFRPSRGPGASKKWTTVHLLFTFAYVRMKLSTKPALTVSGVCKGFPERWPKFLADRLPKTGAIRQMYDKAKNIEEIVNYNAEQHARFGPNWFQDFLDGVLSFDPRNTKASQRIPRLVDLHSEYGTRGR